MPEKKSIWDILDAVLEPAVQVYTGIRGTKTDGGSPDKGSPDKQPVPFQPCDEGFILKDGKCVREKKMALEQH